MSAGRKRGVSASAVSEVMLNELPILRGEPSVWQLEQDAVLRNDERAHQVEANYGDFLIVEELPVDRGLPCVGSRG